MLLCTKIRLQVSAADAKFLEFMQGKCRGLYNWWVMRLRDGERWSGRAEAKAAVEASKAHDPKRRFVYGKLLREVYCRLDKAMPPSFAAAHARRARSPDSRACVPGTVSSRCATRLYTSRGKVIAALCVLAVEARPASPNATLTVWPDSPSQRLSGTAKWRSRGMHGDTTTPPLWRRSQMARRRGVAS